MFQFSLYQKFIQNNYNLRCQSFIYITYKHFLSHDRRKIKIQHKK